MKNFMTDLQEGHFSSPFGKTAPDFEIIRFSEGYLDDMKQLADMLKQYDEYLMPDTKASINETITSISDLLKRCMDKPAVHIKSKF